jgi:hypothetical protein
MFLAPLLLVTLSGRLAQPVAHYAVDGRGIVSRLDVEGCVFFEEMGMGLVAPGWRGSLGDQHALAEKSVTVTHGKQETIYESVLVGKSQRARLRQVVRPIAGGVRLEYELTPEVELQVETIALRATIPAAPHRNTTHYVALSGEEFDTGRFPQELPVQYHFLPGRLQEWVALVAANGAAVRLRAEGLTLGMQDTRKFGGKHYELLACSMVRGRLAPGKPVRLALEITATTSAAVAQAEAKARAQTLSGFPLTSRAKLCAGAVRADRTQLGVYEHVELTADVTATFDNPFDPDDVRLDAEIRGPDGRCVTVPGFFDVPCRLETDVAERVRPAGPAAWRVRFTPTRPGKYQAIVRVRDRSGQAACPTVSFEAVASPQPGFVRVAKDAPLYFQFDNGQPYFPVGENICWARAAKPLADYAAWFGGLGAAGGNWARLWLATTEKGLEWCAPPTPKPGRGHYLGLGRYAIDNSWRLDQVVRLAEQHGIRLMFCIGTFGEIKESHDYFGANQWVSNPYNAANGGPCATPQEFFTNPTARKLYQRRLRYLIARWGYSPHVFAWEFWNEYRAPAAWVGEMAAYLKQYDPNRHLVSTTYGDDDVWRLPDVDFTMTHHYGDSGSISDFSPLFVHHTQVQRAFGKPYFIAEFGIDWRTSDTKYDPDGRGQNLHNGLWAGVLAGGAGTPMLWYWDGYVHEKNLYSVFRPVARFVAGVDWPRTRLTPIDGLTLASNDREPERFSTLEFPTGASWEDKPPVCHVLHRDGRIDGGPIASTIGNPRKPGVAHAVSFQLDMPAAGEFTVRLGNVSSRARLQIHVDERLALDEPLKTGPPGEGPWKASTYYPEWNIWQSDYDRDYSVRVPAGKHVVRIANAEGDWLSLRGGRVSPYLSSRYPYVRALGLQAPGLALVWLQDRTSTWRAVLEKVAPQQMTGLRLTVPGLAVGAYQLEWWNTYTGAIFQRARASAADGKLTVPVPTFTRDVAVVIRQEGKP